MLENCNGKLFVYASSFVSRGRRLEPVRAATEKMARRLKLGFEVKTFRKKFAPIYVYYANGDDEPVPIYCLRTLKYNVSVTQTPLNPQLILRKVHPKHSALR